MSNHVTIMLNCVIIQDICGIHFGIDVIIHVYWTLVIKGVMGVIFNEVGWGGRGGHKVLLRPPADSFAVVRRQKTDYFLFYERSN
jgi:hypothetical protein